MRHDVGSSFYERNEIYISGTKGSIARIITPEEFFLFSGYKHRERSQIEREMEEGIRYPVQYENLMPISHHDTGNFDIIDHRREKGVDLIYAYDLEKVET